MELALIKLCHLHQAVLINTEQGSGLKKKSLKESGDATRPEPEELPVNFPSAKKEISTSSSEKLIEKKPLTGNSSVKLTSLNSLKKELLVKPATEENEIKEEVVFEEIDKYAFQQVWKSYLMKLVAEKKNVALKILEAFPPEVVDNKTVMISVGTESYLHTLNGEREEMYYFLKKELDKNAIDLVIIVDKQRSKSESTRKPYTAGEKFNHMVKKNPKLKDLKDRLKLELDF